MVSTVLVTSLIARALGPQEFGIYVFVLSIYTFIQAALRMGLDTYVSKIVNIEEDREKLKETLTRLTLAINTTALCLVPATIIICYFYQFSLESNEFRLSLIALFLTLFLSPLNIHEYLANGLKLNIYVSTNRSIAIIVGSTTRALLVQANAPLSALVLSLCVEPILISIGNFRYIAKKHDYVFVSWSLQRFKERKSIFRSVFPLALSSIVGYMYIKVDQLYVFYIKGAEGLGIYSVATKFSEGVTAILFIIATLAYPSLSKKWVVSLDEYAKYFKQLLLLSLIISLSAAGMTLITGPWIISQLFGIEYISSIISAFILLISCYYLFVGFMTSRDLMLRSQTRQILYRTTTGLIVNIITTPILLSIIGIPGAALSTLISLFFAYVIYDLFYDRYLLRLKSLVLGPIVEHLQ